ncbi:hypothetical protein B0H12DRAFT_1229952 [Mycena haematopus]|nr:hypothetical protein B0H12DRAFT_1229952 [Mycena haematopus]
MRKRSVFFTNHNYSLLEKATGTNDQIVMLLTPRWTDAAYDERMYALGREWYAQVTAAAAALGTYHPFMYLNFAAGSQKPFCGYGSDNVNFLRQTALKSTGVFQSLLPGGFKVFEEC